jgi:hypothetical protein
MLANRGLAIPPGGVPVRVAVQSSLDMTPARRNCQSRSLMSLSATRFLLAFLRLLCGIVSQELALSPAMLHCYPHPGAPARRLRREEMAS